MSFNTELDFIAKVHGAGLLPEELRVAAVVRISELCLHWADTEPFRKERVRALFTSDELTDLARRFRSDIVDEFGREPGEWNDRLVFGDRKQHMRDLKDAIATFAQFYPDDDELAAEAAAAVIAIEEFAKALEEEEDESSSSSTPVALKLSPTDQLAKIFDDVDD